MMLVRRRVSNKSTKSRPRFRSISIGWTGQHESYMPPGSNRSRSLARLRKIELLVFHAGENPRGTVGGSLALFPDIGGQGAQRLRVAIGGFFPVELRFEVGHRHFFLLNALHLGIAVLVVLFHASLMR